MSKETKLDKKEISAARKLSSDHLKAAKLLLDESLHKDSVSRSYYAVYELISALLNKEGLVVKTHSGLVSNFSKLFIKTGKLPKKYSAWLSNIKEKRSSADYERMESVTKKEAEETYQQAKKMTSTISKLLD